MNFAELEKDGSFSLQVGPFGLRHCRLATVVAGRGQADLPWRPTAVKATASSLVAKFAHPHWPGLTTELTIRQTTGGLTLKRTLANRTGHDLFIDRWSDLTGATVTVGRTAAVYSVENCRQSYLGFLTDCQVERPLERPVEFGTLVMGQHYAEPTLGRTLTYGKTEDQPFPCQVVMAGSRKRALTIGLLSNAVSDLVVELTGRRHGAGQQLQIDTTRLFRGQPAYLVRNDSVATGETIYLGATATTEVAVAVAEYKSLLHKALPERTDAQRQLPFKAGRFWGSWNMGLYQNISHDLLLQQAQIIAQTRPDLKWIQVDDGYTVAEKPGPFLLEAPGLDRQKFPRGMRAFTDDIRKLGLRPAVWLGLIVNPDYPVPAFAQDWLLLKADGTPLRILPAGNYFLDFSLAPVRAYFERVLQTVIHDWGFEGLKVDFWSDHFCCNDLAYRNPDFTGAMLRDWFWQTVRQALGPDGFALACCCVGNGNPFHGKYIDAFRCGVDIGHGADLTGQIQSAFWYGMLAKFGVGDHCLPDLDSMGDLSTIISEPVHRLWNSFAGISGGNLEYAGLLDRQHPHWGPKAVAAFNWVPLGQMGQPLDFPVPLQGNLTPMVWVNTSADGQTVYAAVINWHEHQSSRPFQLTLQSLGLKPAMVQHLHEFWFDEKLPVAKSLRIPAIPKLDARVYVFQRR